MLIGTGLLSNQGEKSINLHFIMVPLRKKVLKYGTPKPREGCLRFSGLGLSFWVVLYRLGLAKVSISERVPLPIGPKVVPFWGSYLEFYKVIQKGTTLGPMGIIRRYRTTREIKSV